MSLTLAERTRKFWCAAYFHRRAPPDRPRDNAVRALAQVAHQTTGHVHHRAEHLMKEIIVNDSDHHPPRAD